MTDSVIIELLVLSLLLAVNARLFFVSRGQRDAMVLLSPVALFICVLGFFAWDITLLNGAIFIFTFFVFLENLQGLWHFFNKLYVDYFSPFLWLVSIINILLILGLGFFVVVFRPVPAAEDLQVQERNLVLTGSLQSGLRQRMGSFDSVDVMVMQLKPASAKESWTERGSRRGDVAGIEFHSSSLPLVLWVTDGRTTARRVRPLAAELAALGYEVVVADFNQGLISSFKTRLNGIFFLDKFHEGVARLTRESSLQYGALLDYFGGSRALSQRRVLLLGDGYSGQGAEATSLLNDFIEGVYVVSSPEENTKIEGWAQGFGPVGETAPWVNYLVCKSGFWESRDMNHIHVKELAEKIHKDYETESIVEVSLEENGSQDIMSSEVFSQDVLSEELVP